MYRRSIADRRGVRNQVVVDVKELDDLVAGGKVVHVGEESVVEDDEGVVQDVDQEDDEIEAAGVVLRGEGAPRVGGSVVAGEGNPVGDVPKRKSVSKTFICSRLLKKYKIHLK